LVMRSIKSAKVTGAAGAGRRPLKNGRLIAVKDTLLVARCHAKPCLC
jgi:hypothetical protein